MSGPSASQLTIMRGQRTASLRETCVLTPAVAEGDTLVSTSLVCAINPAQGGIDGGAGVPLSRRPKYSVVLPYGTEIHTGDRFTWNGKTLEIAEVVEPKTNAMAVHADCIEIRT